MSKTTARAAAVAMTATLFAQGAMAQTPKPPAPKDFAQDASHSDNYEIMAAHVAVTQSQDPRIRSFAQEMIKDHTRLNGDLRRAVAVSGLPQPDPGMSADQAKMLGSLQSLRGADFDKAYAKQQTLAHTQAVAVEGTFASAGADLNLRNAARSALPTIQSHLTMAQQLRGATGGS